MAKDPTFVGIDLGTTYSAVAFLNNHGKVEIAPNDRSQPVTPSVVHFPDGRDEEPVVGERAKRMARFSPDRVIECVKRHMGDATVDFDVDGETYSPEEISAIILRELKNMAQLHLNRPVTEAVITVPAYFDDGERHATKLAGELAGLKVLGILNEPTAAALAFGLDHATEKGKALIYDLGGGTFDVTVVELEGGKIRVLATDGVRLLGGVDWNAKLLDYVAHEFMVKHGPDPREDLKSAQRLADEVEAAKRSLSSHSRAKLFIECGEVAGQVLVTREKFEDLTEGLLLQTEAYTEAVLEKAELEWSDIDRILLAGGSTRMPMVREMLRELSGMEPDTSLNPDECVAIGACYFAAKLKGEVKDDSLPVDEALLSVAQSIDVQNVASHSIGIRSVIEGQRRNLIMIPEQTPLPAEVTRYFATHAHNQVTVEVKVLEGDSEDPEDCSELGTAVITGLPPNRKRGSKVSVTYEYSSEGILTVRANDFETGRSCTATINRGFASDAPEYVQAMRERLDSLYLLEGKTADEVDDDSDDSGHAIEDLPVAAPIVDEPEYVESESLGGEVAEPTEPSDDEDYDGDRVVSTMQLDRIRDEMSSIAGSDEEDEAQDEDDGAGDVIDPWQLAADQGLLDGETVSGDGAYEGEDEAGGYDDDEAYPSAAESFAGADDDADESYDEGYDDAYGTGDYGTGDDGTTDDGVGEYDESGYHDLDDVDPTETGAYPREGEASYFGDAQDDSIEPPGFPSTERASFADGPEPEGYGEPEAYDDEDAYGEPEDESGADYSQEMDPDLPSAYVEDRRERGGPES